MTLALELIVLLAAIMIGARAGGVGMGLWGGVGLAALVFGFGEKPGSIPGEVLLIILTVIMAASAMEAAGGIDYLVRIAAGIIRKSPRHVTIIAPVVAYAFTFLSGTGHVFYPLLPVIYEVAIKGGVRPERPIAVATIASQQAITASPVSAATAALIAILGSQGVGLAQILMICVPATLLGISGGLPPAKSNRQKAWTNPCNRSRLRVPVSRRGRFSPALRLLCAVDFSPRCEESVRQMPL